MQEAHLINRRQIRERLLATGLKATQQRIVILEALTQLQGSHPSAEIVFQKLTTTDPGISLGTVYKTLDRLVAIGLARQVRAGNSRRFDVNEHAHGHIYCTNTEEIIDYTDPELDNLLQEYFKKKQFQNFSIRDITIQIVGTKPVPEHQVIIN